MLSAHDKPVALRIAVSRATELLQSARANARSHLGGACGAAAAGIYLTAPTLVSPILPVALALFGLSIVLLGHSRPPKVLLGLFALILASVWLSVVVSAISGGYLEQTIWLALLTSALAPLAWIRDVRPILQWLTPVWLAQAGMSLYQWLATETYRVNGIAENTNAGAAFLLLGCVYLMNGNSRAKWLILPMVAALPFTGSRWVAVVAAMVVVGLFARRYVDWRYIAIGIAVTLSLILIIGWEDIHNVFTRPALPILSVHVSGYPDQANLPPAWTPRGFYDSGIHIVPWRMMHETGIVSGLAWTGATIYGLLRAKYDYRWWLLLTVALLSGMYYFTWVGPLGWAWWLLVRDAHIGPGNHAHSNNHGN